MSDDENKLKVVQFKPPTNKETDFELGDVSAKFIENVRLNYIDTILGEEDDLDAETVRLSYQLARELRNTIADCEYDISLYLHVYMETLYSNDAPPYHDNWFPLYAHDDMQINAYRIMQSVWTGLLELVMGKIDITIETPDDENEKVSEENEEE